MYIPRDTMKFHRNLRALWLLQCKTILRPRDWKFSDNNFFSFFFFSYFILISLLLFFHEIIFYNTTFFLLFSFHYKKLLELVFWFHGLLSQSENSNTHSFILCTQKVWFVKSAPPGIWKMIYRKIQPSSIAVFFPQFIRIKFTKRKKTY